MKHQTRILSSLAGVVVAASLGAPAAFAQQAPAANANAPKAEWLKVCGKNEKTATEECMTESFIMAPAGNAVGAMQLREQKKDGKSKIDFVATVPPGFVIPNGVNLVIDEDAKQPIAGRYMICAPNNCFVEFKFDDQILARIKKGSKATVLAQNQQGQWVGATVSLAGFSKAYDSAGLDAKAYQEKRKAFAESQKQMQTELQAKAQKDLQSGLLQKADEQRKQAQEQKAKQ